MHNANCKMKNVKCKIKSGGMGEQGMNEWVKWL
jgi:hypothetical protein